MSIPPVRFAVLLSLSFKKQSWDDSPVHKFAKLLSSFRSDNVKLHLYIGYDKDDRLLIENKGKLLNSFENIEVDIREFPETNPVNICRIWRDLASKAYDDGCHFFVLLGDDVNINDSQWPEKVVEEFKISEDFGCVALNDSSVNASGFPTFPVLSRTHMDIFKGQIIPDDFINQDGDPYLFALYRSFNHKGKPSARFVNRGIELMNGYGGPKLIDCENYIPPRYEPIHIDWKNSILSNGVNAIDTWARSNNMEAISKVTTIDIVVPCYNHIREDALHPIVSLLLETVDHVNLKVILIIDNPLLAKAGGIEFLREWERNNDYFGKLIVRVNETNQGASSSRNVGLRESSADYVVFLDDDVTPRKNLIAEYSAAINEHGGEYLGFVGLTLIECAEDKSLWNMALRHSGVSYFWDIATKQSTTPWGITANQCVKRIPDIEFDDNFSRSGGGEDIDFNIKLCRKGMKKNVMRCVPKAICDHPRWRNIHDHVFKWGLSDSYLILKYPELSYLNWPNALESVIIFIMITSFANYFVFKWNHYHVLKQFVISTITPLVMDCAIDVVIGIRGCEIHSLQNTSLVTASAILGNTIKNAVEMGHLWGPISRFEFIPFKRFDWFCSTVPAVIPNERMSAAFRFTIFVVVWIGICNSF